MAHVVFLQSAESDVKDLRRYVVKNFGTQAWQVSYSKLKDSIAVIQSHPESGSIPGELTKLGLGRYRQVLSGMNRIIYELRGDTAYVHLICDARRDLQSMLTRRLLTAL
ncbi:type II toxin-antitoxin system RelE/ParE family toxin [Trinickia sp. NRRL B-1857]|uniref:type II toxin-antitoxin system RelE/ParE family toxin n=1 Tax=Trinickia sp. NRRL B-1857 TaxID=3162879 RepID=UPI003D290507